MKLVVKTADDLAAERAALDAEINRAAALAYLDSTDWLVVRQTETGQPVPQDVLDARAKARGVLSS